MYDSGGVNLMCTFRGDVVWNFYSHINGDKIKVQKKNKKIKNLKKNKKQTNKDGVDIWWTSTFSQSLALIRLAVSENRGLRTDGRTDDGLHDDSSFAVQ